ncbi:hypothetical protein SMSP2_00969 [Limihaloglobus sulfuriphilus]|uniref:Uncharacterized protein n=1 Tax=Limihaloglobus sulfuriphilus TaxID=1851148 RepID=A0A1Q2MD44_9BACT|nr:hypothetical protein SMSP2_00969 [Limihaloglobus sulfuriphilus]
MGIGELNGLIGRGWLVRIWKNVSGVVWIKFVNLLYNVIANTDMERIKQPSPSSFLSRQTYAIIKDRTSTAGSDARFETYLL